MHNDLAISVENVSKRYRLGSVTRLNLSDEIVYRVRRLLGVDPDVLSKVDTMRHKRDFWALRNVSLRLIGEAVALIGANGAGKSTMLKIFAHYNAYNWSFAGGWSCGDHAGSGYGVSSEMTGRENIYLNGAILGMPRKEISRKFDTIVAFAGIDRFLDTPVKRYSSGMYVRLAFAVASHLEPDILIVDEVLSVGDAGFQKRCVERMQTIAANSHTTVIFVSHSMPNVRQLCKRCIWFENGGIRMDGPTAIVSSAYETSQQNTTEFPIETKC